MARTLMTLVVGVALGGAPAARTVAQPLPPGAARPWSPELRIECDGGNADACRLGGLALEQGLGIAADPTSALSMLSRGCELGDRGSCLRFGFLASRGRGVPADSRAALKAYERACELGAGDGCSGAGFLLAYGDASVIPNRARGEVLLRKACEDGHHPRACAALGSLVEQRGDRAAALRIYQACCGKDGGCCAQGERLAKVQRRDAPRKAGR